MDDDHATHNTTIRATLRRAEARTTTAGDERSMLVLRVRGRDGREEPLTIWGPGEIAAAALPLAGQQVEVLARTYQGRDFKLGVEVVSVVAAS